MGPRSTGHCRAICEKKCNRAIRPYYQSRDFAGGLRGLIRCFYCNKIASETTADLYLNLASDGSASGLVDASGYLAIKLSIRQRAPRLVLTVKALELCTGEAGHTRLGVAPPVEHTTHASTHDCKEAMCCRLAPRNRLHVLGPPRQPSVLRTESHRAQSGLLE